MFAVSKTSKSIDASMNIHDQLTLIFHSYPLAIRLIESGKINVKPLITQRFPVEKSIEGFQILRNGTEGVVKVLLQYED